MKDVNIRRAKPEDFEQLELWRESYPDANLELPKGYHAPGVETAVGEEGGKIVAALTGTLAVIIDPAICDPNASPIKVLRTLQALERTLAYVGSTGGAVDAYVPAPEHLTEWIAILEKNGYQRTAQKCVILRRPLNPDLAESESNNS